MKKTKLITCLIAVMLCIAAFSMSFAYYASDENGIATPPEYIDSITVSKEDVKLDENNITVSSDIDSFFESILSVFGNSDALTPIGNMTLIDDILQDESTVNVERIENEQKSKQFITVQTKNGNYFYIIIDRSGENENVYFLNLVDESDLLALLTDDEAEDIVVDCTCKDKCVVGSINTSCEVCRINLSDCIGKETIIEPEHVVDEQEKKEPTSKPESNNSMIVIVLVIVIAAGGAVYWFKFRSKPEKNTGNDDLDDYDFGQDEEDKIDDTELMEETEEI